MRPVPERGQAPGRMSRRSGRSLVVIQLTRSTSTRRDIDVSTPRIALGRRGRCAGAGQGRTIMQIRRTMLLVLSLVCIALPGAAQEADPRTVQQRRAALQEREHYRELV